MITEISKISRAWNQAEGTLYDEGLGDTQYYWHFNNNGTDSSEWVDSFGNTVYKDGVYIKESGILVAYGWLASDVSVSNADAWVGLFVLANIKNMSEKQWTPLAIQPWCKGVECKNGQYVSFSAPVVKGMQLKIMTGFAVKDTPSFIGDRTLAFKAKGDVKNTFVGYVIQ